MLSKGGEREKQKLKAEFLEKENREMNE